MPLSDAATTSKPAVNALSPAPDSTMARTEGECETWSIMLRNSCHMGSYQAFSLEGRLVWMWRTVGEGVVRRKWVGGGWMSIFLVLVFWEGWGVEGWVWGLIWGGGVQRVVLDGRFVNGGLVDVVGDIIYDLGSLGL